MAAKVEKTTLRHQALAQLYVIRWARYKRSPHVLSRNDHETEFARLLAKKKKPAKGRIVPLPPVVPITEAPDFCHDLNEVIGCIENLDPSPQEAYLTVELAIRITGFTHERYLASYARCAWEYFTSTYAPRKDANADCLGLMVFLGLTLSKFVTKSKDL